MWPEKIGHELYEALAGDRRLTFTVTDERTLYLAILEAGVPQDRLLGCGLLSVAVEWWRETGELLAGMTTKEDEHADE